MVKLTVIFGGNHFGIVEFFSFLSIWNSGVSFTSCVISSEELQVFCILTSKVLCIKCGTDDILCIANWMANHMQNLFIGLDELSNPHIGWLVSCHFESYPLILCFCRN